MTRFNVKGMSCAACQAAVTRAVSKVKGVEKCEVSLLTNSMTVEGSFSESDVIAAVKKAGYSASLPNAAVKKDAAPQDAETPAMVRRLLASVVILIPLMYISMGHHMWGWYLPPALAESHVAQGIIQLVLAGAVMVINQRFFISGCRSLVHLAPNMDALVAIGAGASFIYSLFSLIMLSVTGQMRYTDGFYFESAATILTLITVGKTLEARSKGKTTSALSALISMSPKTAAVERDGKEVTVDVSEVRAGDIFVLRPGDRIPVDGQVVEGGGSADESAVTGESVPVDKAAGDSVIAGTVNLTGFMRCRADRVGGDTTLSQIIALVENAAASKAPIAKTADRVAGVFVPAVMAIALVTAGVWLALGQSAGYALARAVSVLVISCPCALGLATPVAIMAGSGVGARHGILYKTAAALEGAGRVKTVVLDKTGTITSGTPEVTDVIAAKGISKTALLQTARSLELKSEHPFARAIMRYAEDIPPLETSGFTALAGCGVTANIDGAPCAGGSLSYIKTLVDIPAELENEATRLSGEGKTPLFFTRGGKICGIIAAADSIKPDSAAAIARMQDMGLETVMLTGDNSRTANAVGSAAGVKRVIAQVMPSGKEEVVRELSKKGAVAMVGDGINDAPALTRADVGIAIGAGTDVALDAADIVLVGSSLTDAVNALRLGRATLRNIRQNLFWAFIYNTLGIPLAAGVFTSAFGWTLDPMFAAAAMSLSSVCVVTNALRLNLFRAYKPIQNIIKKEKKTMEKTLKIEGMMCPKCEQHVREALEGIDGVESAIVSHKDGTAKLTLSKDVEDMYLTDAVEHAGYTVITE